MDAKMQQFGLMILLMATLGYSVRAQKKKLHNPCASHNGGKPLTIDGVPVDCARQQRCFSGYTCIFVRKTGRCCKDVTNTTRGRLTASQQLFAFAPGNRETRRLANIFFRILNVTETLSGGRISGSVSSKFQKGNSNAIAAAVSEFCTPPKPYHYHCNRWTHYRTSDGSCNNLQNPSWGKSNTPELRFLPAKYDNDFDSPRRLAVNGLPLPSARKISNDVFKQLVLPVPSPENTVLVMTWGQFTDHDFIRTPMSLENADECCEAGGGSIPECFPISIPADDDFFDTTCMPMSRSLPVAAADCTLDKREQINSITSYLDASNVYGSTLEEQNFIRKGSKGKLKTKGRLLPNGQQRFECQKPLLPPVTPKRYCFAAGDGRVNIVPTLAAIHNTYILEHNRIVKRLRNLNNHWTDEMLFQEGRKIIGAFHQHVTYGEYLPTILDEDTRTKFNLFLSPGFNDEYDETVNAATSNAFGAAAFRYGHTQIPAVQGVMDADDAITELNLEDTFFLPTVVQRNNGVNQPGNFRWMTRTAAAKTDRIFEDGIRNKLFIGFAGNSFDLTALNIQRGRDHGLPSYNAWRDWCDLSHVDHFGTGVGGLVDHIPDNAIRLSEGYSDVDDIELFPGGVTEKPVPGGNIGPTFSCLFGHQFRNWKIGDRFWYERDDKSTGFKAAQLQQIKKVTLAKIICVNQKLDTIQPNVFRKPGPGNELVKCSSLPKVNLNQWKETVHETKAKIAAYEIPIPQ